MNPEEIGCFVYVPYTLILLSQKKENHKKAFYIGFDVYRYQGNWKEIYPLNECKTFDAKSRNQAKEWYIFLNQMKKMQRTNETSWRDKEDGESLNASCK